MKNRFKLRYAFKIIGKYTCKPIMMGIFHSCEFVNISNTLSLICFEGCSSSTKSLPQFLSTSIPFPVGKQLLGYNGMVIGDRDLGWRGNGRRLGEGNIYAIQILVYLFFWVLVCKNCDGFSFIGDLIHNFFIGYLFTLRSFLNVNKLFSKYNLSLSLFLDFLSDTLLMDNYRHWDKKRTEKYLRSKMTSE
jgi:hypothetical protein